MGSESIESQESGFNIELSPIKDAYVLLRANSPLELSNRYTEEDQKLMKSQAWDYANPDLITNRVKDILEAVPPQNFAEEETEWVQEILWFWYHHAISCAVARYGDKHAAQEYAEKALEFQPADHPNKITRLLYLLVNDKLEEAEAWAGHIEEASEKDTARDLIEGYKRGKIM